MRGYHEPMATSIGSRLFLSLSLLVPAVGAQDFGQHWWVIGSQGRGGRSPVHTDAVEALLVRGQWKKPSGSPELRLPGGKTLSWKAIPMKKGRVAAPRGGYAWTEVLSDRRQTVLLAAKGHSLVYVNGVPRVGNPYRTGWYRIPVLLEKGPNEFLFRTGRGAIEPKLLPVTKPLFFSGLDHTLPDIVQNEPIQTGLGIVLIHAAPTWLHGAWIEIDAPQLGTNMQGRLQKIPLPTLAPNSTYKAWVPFTGAAPMMHGSLHLSLTLWSKDASGLGRSMDHIQVKLATKEPGERHKRVYRSTVDGSAQYYAVVPPSLLPKRWQRGTQVPEKKALFLTLHGASVEATGQAASYSQKTWGYLVAPTNRRPYGFDWEDWGRRDAMDVLDLAENLYPIDRSRVYLTGHSMGGHGTWQIGATYPARFAAIGPSAGWVSFWSYSSGRRYDNPGPIENLLLRAASPSDTLGLEYNYKQQGVYILHGDADKNVPIREARAMWKELEGFHHDHVRHEEKGAGHWWNRRDDAGADCVDWREMFDFFARRRIPQRGEVRDVDFTTMNPAISDTCHWVTILEQQKKLAKSRVQIHLDPNKGRFNGTTDNVRMLRLSMAPVPEGHRSIAITLDGHAVIAGNPDPSGLILERDAKGQWHVGSDLDEVPPLVPENVEGDGLDREFGLLSRIFQSSFKQAFDRDFLLIVGTGGRPAENLWARNKARYDAETFWYRGNGSVEILLDTEFKPGAFKDRNLILYGNAQTNAAWKVVLKKCPIEIHEDGIRVGDHKVQGEDLACLFVQPRADASPGLVAAISGTGLAGMRLTERLPWTVSGVHYPDLIIIGSDMLETGSLGVRAAGFFGREGGLRGAEIVWRDR